MSWWAVSGRKGWMVQPCSQALPPGPSLPQLAGWNLARDALARDATEAKGHERSAEVTYEGEALN